MRQIYFLLLAGIVLMAAFGCSKEWKTEHAIRNPENNFVTLKTDYGNLVLELYRDVAPAHADSFLARTNDGFYDSTKFHRIIDGFMIQGGDPEGTGMGGAGYHLNAEFSDLPHVEGTLSMARARDPNSASSQFFIVLAPAPHLNNQYTVFGHLVNGYDTLRKIAKVETVMSPTGEKSKPAEDVWVVDAYQSDPEGNPVS
jgi:cyclophilin family peptidyl-prolyl cis-trans isomerase